MLRAGEEGGSAIKKSFLNLKQSEGQTLVTEMNKNMFPTMLNSRVSHANIPLVRHASMDKTKYLLGEIQFFIDLLNVLF